MMTNKVKQNMNCYRVDLYNSPLDYTNYSLVSWGNGLAAAIAVFEMELQKLHFNSAEIDRIIDTLVTKCDDRLSNNIDFIDFEIYIGDKSQYKNLRLWSI